MFFILFYFILNNYNKKSEEVIETYIDSGEKSITKIDKDIFIDLNKCGRDSISIMLPFGSELISVLGKQGDYFIINYYYEIEMGESIYICKVPIDTTSRDSDLGTKFSLQTFGCILEK